MRSQEHIIPIILVSEEQYIDTTAHVKVWPWTAFRQGDTKVPNKIMSGFVPAFNKPVHKLII
jgi:hypothetical protein